MRVLITNIMLAERSGTEVVTSELARGLKQRGHQVAVFAPVLGKSAAALAADGIAVTDRIEAVPFRPEIIHGHHNIALAAALAQFPDVPALFVSHDAVEWRDRPLLSPQVVRYFAVDEINRARAAKETATINKSVEILPNTVDLDQYAQRAPLPERPRRALLPAKHRQIIEPVRAAARQANLTLDEVGPAFGRTVDDLAARLKDCDIVFATGRIALEAFAVGCAVVVCDGRGLAGLATAAVVDDWRRNNFGLKLLTRTPTAEAVADEIARYDARDAAMVSTRIREIAALRDQLDRIEAIHREIVSGWSTSAARERAHSEALGAFTASWLRAQVPAQRDLALHGDALAAELEQQRKVVHDLNKIIHDLKMTLAVTLNSRSRLMRELWRVTTRKLRGDPPP